MQLCHLQVVGVTLAKGPNMDKGPRVAEDRADAVDVDVAVCTVNGQPRDVDVV